MKNKQILGSFIIALLSAVLILFIVEINANDQNDCIEYNSVSVYYENEDLQATELIGEFDNGILFICER